MLQYATQIPLQERRLYYPQLLGKQAEKSFHCQPSLGIAHTEENLLSKIMLLFWGNLLPMTDGSMQGYKGLAPLPQMVTIYRVIPAPGFPLGSAEATVGTTSLQRLP